MILHSQSSNTSIRDSKFENIYGASEGGALYFNNFFDETWFEDTEIQVSNSSFKNISSYWDGGAIFS